jgi:anaerobic selenocysteine-containing dehydrogenase
LPNLLPAYQAVTNPDLRKKFDLAWGAALPEKPGLTLVEMMNAAHEGKIRAMYIMGENPVVSDPDCSHVVEALNALEFLVVQDIFLQNSSWRTWSCRQHPAWKRTAPTPIRSGGCRGSGRRCSPQASPCPIG